MKDIDTVLKRIISEVAETEVLIENISEDTNLISELEFNSIITIKLIVEIEKEFRIVTDEEALNKELFEKYGNLKKYVMQSIGTGT